MRSRVPRVPLGPSFRRSTDACPPRPSIPRGRRDRCSRVTNDRNRTLGWPRTTDSLCPTCVRETRSRILSGEQSIETLVNDKTGEIPAQILERNGQIVIEKTCPQHGTFTDTLAIDPGVSRSHRKAVPGPRLSRGRRHPPQPRHVVDPAWPRRGAHDRPDQSLQHDVRPVLHGREPGRVRARAHAR